MSGIPGTNVAAMVVPFDTEDIYATHNDKYGRGGFRVHDTLAERDAITTLRRKAGMWVRVLEDGKVYELGGDLTTWTEVSIGGSTGGAYIHSQPSANTSWLINHNLGYKPTISITDTGGNELDADVVHQNLNQVIISFTIATAGFARLT